jgi:hypothetical protein
MTTELINLAVFFLVLFLLAYVLFDYFNRPRPQAERANRARKQIAKLRYRPATLRPSHTGNLTPTTTRPAQPAGPRDRLSYVRPCATDKGGFAAGDRPRF